MDTEIKRLLTPRRFLFIGGSILVTIGSLGVVKLFQRISPAGFFNPPYWINWFHFTLGIILLNIAFFGKSKLHVIVTLIPTVVGTTIGLLGLLLGSYAAKRFDNPQLADISDPLVHLFLGLFAFWAFTNRIKSKSRNI